MILAGDIGGTKSNIALMEVKPGQKIGQDAGCPTVAFIHRYSNHEYKQFADIIEDFLRRARSFLSGSKIAAAGFGVAGPITGRQVRITNLPWGLDAEVLERQLGTSHIALLNDLEATGYALACLAPEDFCTLNKGEPVAKGRQALIAAGTGLGEAILAWNGRRYTVAPSEGGHADFAPRTEQEIELLRYLKTQHSFVSFELVLSGRGFLTLHEFLDKSVRHASFEEAGADPAPEITRLGLAGTCPVCVQTLDLFVTLYGAEAGNLALKALSRGGVFVAGGIAPKILPKIQSGLFFRAFCEKEKFQEFLSHFPIHVVLNEEAPLLGAAAEAAARELAATVVRQSV
jgi:glucokinase